MSFVWDKMAEGSQWGLGFRHLLYKMPETNFYIVHKIHDELRMSECLLFGTKCHKLHNGDWVSDTTMSEPSYSLQT